MADYLTNTEENLTIEEQKWIFKCRVEDMKIKGNQRWKYKDMSCPKCMKNLEETQSHILFCDFLLEKKTKKYFIYNRTLRIKQWRYWLFCPSGKKRRKKI